MLENSGYSVTELINFFNSEIEDEHIRNISVLACMSVHCEDKNLKDIWLNWGA